METKTQQVKTLCEICKKNPCETVKAEGALEIGGNCPDVELIEHEPPYCEDCGKPLEKIDEVYNAVSRWEWNPDKKQYELVKESTNDCEQNCHECFNGSISDEAQEFFCNHVEVELKGKLTAEQENALKEFLKELAYPEDFKTYWENMAKATQANIDDKLVEALQKLGLL